ncbi:unnamed protein product, partial [Amoebophrya sp. A25]
EKERLELEQGSSMTDEQEATGASTSRLAKPDPAFLTHAEDRDVRLQSDLALLRNLKEHPDYLTLLDTRCGSGRFRNLFRTLFDIPDDASTTTPSASSSTFTSMTGGRSEFSPELEEAIRDRFLRDVQASLRTCLEFQLFQTEMKHAAKEIADYREGTPLAWVSRVQSNSVSQEPDNMSKTDLLGEAARGVFLIKEREDAQQASSSVEDVKDDAVADEDGGRRSSCYPSWEEIYNQLRPTGMMTYGISMSSALLLRYTQDQEKQGQNNKPT